MRQHHSPSIHNSSNSKNLLQKSSSWHLSEHLPTVLVVRISRTCHIIILMIMIMMMIIIKLSWSLSWWWLSAFANCAGCQNIPHLVIDHINDDYDDHDDDYHHIIIIMMMIMVNICQLCWSSEYPAPVVWSSYYHIDDGHDDDGDHIIILMMIMMITMITLSYWWWLWWWL